ncbi:MAG: DUF3039 domain-containing protein [Aeriscardovia sp.]|nr:DUF3039 domain-containing protein [Aeriscardovia sp.]
MTSNNDAPSTAVKENPEAKIEEESEISGDFASEKFAHYVEKEELAKAKEGMPVVALCGKIWVPKKYNGAPVCPECQRIYNSLSSGSEN